MKDYLKHPVTIVAFLAALLLVVGGLMPWITIPADSIISGAADELKSTLAIKQYVALGAGVLGFLVILAAAKKGSKGLGVLNLLFGLVGAAVVFTAYVDKDTLSQIGVSSMGVGYYLALVGDLVFLVMTVVTMVVFKKHSAAA